MKKLVAGLFAVVATGTLGPGCAEQGSVDNVDSDGARDPLGVNLEAVGLSAGDDLCGDHAHVASVVDEEGRYLAFCVGDDKASVIQVAPLGVTPIGSPAASCALETYLAATPDDAAVPQALVDACKKPSLIGSRPVSVEPVLVGDPDAIGGIYNSSADCSSYFTFSSNYCLGINAWTLHPQVMDYVRYCASSSGLITTSTNLVASAQGIPDAFEGRMTVAACGTASTNLRGLVKSYTNGAWSTPAGNNINISPNYVGTVDVFLFDVEDGDGYPAGNDLRFIITPSSGGKYRYTGAFVEYYPVP